MLHPGSNKFFNNQFEKSYFERKGQNQGHKVIDLDVIWKEIMGDYACQI